MTRRQTSRVRRHLLAASVVALSLATGVLPSFAQSGETLNVWWVKGFYKAEDDALYAAIKKYEAKAGVKIELSQYPIQDMIPKTVAALDSGAPPDVAYADVYDFQTAGKWAAEGKLADLSSILEPTKAEFAPGTLETAYLFNAKTGKKAYYAFPMKQQTLHIHYWSDMLAQSGFKAEDIPKTWSEFWGFWCDKAQAGLRKASGQRLFGIGQPMGVDSTDSFYSFLTFMDAYNVKLVDDDGKLLVDDPKVKEGLVKALSDYIAPYQKGCTPPSSTSWKDPDNNVAFHNKTTIMTHNATISIPAKWLDDANNETLTAEQRETAKKNYYDVIKTIVFPAKPDGSVFKYRAAVKVGVIFEQAKNKTRAMDFVSFMMADENLQPYIENSLGRWFPVKKKEQKSDFWDKDVHRRAVRDQFAAGTVPFEFTKNYKFTIVNNENVWAKAMNRVVNDKVPVEQAVDEMIKRIKDLAG
jgi:multiple sugar transport system substrate-binding protein